MTLVVGWIDQGCAFLCADSVVSVGRSVETVFAQTSVGELNDRQRGVVEDVVKIVAVSGRIAAAIVGALEPALQFLRGMRRELSHRGEAALRRLLHECSALHAGSQEPFKVLFAHVIGDRPAITMFCTEKSVRTLDDDHPGRMFISGSLSDRWKLHIQNGTKAIRTMARESELTPDDLLATELGFLQSLGVSEYLLDAGVGGAFIGARVSSEGLSWQQDLNLVIYPEHILRGALRLKVVDASKGERHRANDIGVTRVRTFVRDGIAYVRSSLFGPTTLVLRSPEPSRPPSEWPETDEARRWDNVLEIGRHWVLLSIENRRVFVFIRGEQGSALELGKHGSDVIMNIGPEVAAMLASSPARDWEITLFVDDGQVTTTFTASLTPLPSAGGRA